MVVAQCFSGKCRACSIFFLWKYLTCCISSLIPRRLVQNNIFNSAKLVAMKPEIILQSSLLDILFEDRNKDYGAYTLRKGYSNRLSQSMLVTLSIILLVIFIKEMFIEEQRGNPQNSVFVKDVHIRSFLIPVKPAEVKPNIPLPNKKMAQVDNANILIVPDDKADKPIKRQDELDTKLIGLVDTDGEDPSLAPPVIPSDGPGINRVVAPAKPVMPEEMEPLVKAEEMPEFPGGKDAFMRFMMRNLKDPGYMEDGEKIVVRVKFIVDTEGAIKAVEVLQSGGDLDAEVLRVVKKMTRWKPGKQNGKFVSVYFQFPVTFIGKDNL